MTSVNVAVNEYLEQASQIQCDPPRSLRRPTGNPTEFPMDAFPNVLKNSVLAIYDKTQAPIAICAQSVLAAVTLAAQGLADVKLPMGLVKPISNYFITVAESGERKTSTDSLALAPIHLFEEQLTQNYIVEKHQWDIEYAAWQAQQTQILHDKKRYSSQEAKQIALSTLCAPKAQPLSPMLTCSEPTFEGLCRYMVHGQPRIGIFSAEGGQFIGGHGMREENKLKTAAAFSELWDGTDIKRVRGGDGVIILPGRRVCMHLMIQPGVARIFLTDQLLADQGVLSRVLVAAPASLSGTRFYKEPSLESDQKLTLYNQLIHDLLAAPMPLKADTKNELSPRIITLSQEAKAKWINYANIVEAELLPGKKYELIKGLANKLGEHAARLATVLVIAQDPLAAEVNSINMENGIALAKYYASEAVRMCEEGHVDKQILLAERLLNWLHQSWEQDCISLPDVYQRGLSIVNSKNKAIPLITLLEEHGWLVRIKEGQVLEGKFRRDVWRIIRG